MKPICWYGLIILVVLAIAAVLAKHKKKITEKERILKQENSPSFKAINSMINDIEELGTSSEPKSLTLSD